MSPTKPITAVFPQPLQSHSASYWPFTRLPTIPIIGKSVIPYLSWNSISALWLIGSCCTGLAWLALKEEEGPLWSSSAWAAECIVLTKVRPLMKDFFSKNWERIGFSLRQIIISVLKTIKNEEDIQAVLWRIQNTNRECHDALSPLVNIGSQCDGASSSPSADWADWSARFWPISKEAVASRALPKLHVCAETRAPS